jgi:hypothetical protein
MSTHRIVIFLALLLLTSAAIRAVKVYSDLRKGVVDLDNVLACRFEMSSGAMFTMIAASLPS